MAELIERFVTVNDFRDGCLFGVGLAIATGVAVGLVMAAFMFITAKFG